MGPVPLTYRSRERVRLESWHLGPWASCCLNFIIHLCHKDNHNYSLPKSQGVFVGLGAGPWLCQPVLLWRYEAKAIFSWGTRHAYGGQPQQHDRRDAIHVMSQNISQMLQSTKWEYRSDTTVSVKVKHLGDTQALETEERHHVPKIKKSQPVLCFPDRGSRISTFPMHLDGHSSSRLTA